MIFDSHAHYDDESFEGIREDTLRSVFANGVEKIVNVSASLKSIETSRQLSEKFDFVYCTSGVHPSDAKDDMQNKDWLKIVEENYLSNPKCLAIGEIGLDYYYGKDEKQEQLVCFDMQMKLAQKIKAPVIIHDRDAHADTLETMKKYPDVKCVVHSFSGSFEMAREIMNLGSYISVNGVATFKNARVIVDILERFESLHPNALDRILVETDAPYLTPVPFRGNTNRSDYIEYTAQKCAELLKISKSEFLDLTYKNACRFYGLECENI